MAYLSDMFQSKLKGNPVAEIGWSESRGMVHLNAKQHHLEQVLNEVWKDQSRWNKDSLCGVTSKNEGSELWEWVEMNQNKLKGHGMWYYSCMTGEAPT